MTEPCICCEGLGKIQNEDCPLCEGLAHFVDFSKLPLDLPDYMTDFYQETPIEPVFFSLTESSKRLYLDSEIEKYFTNIFDSVSTTGSGSISDESNETDL